MEMTKEVYIEDLLREVPGAAAYLRTKGIKCLACGEPIWGTLESAAREKGFSDVEIAAFVADLIELKRSQS
ncbi:MAG: DUF1858 domain-containing protein [Deferribacteres bacterium]|nr:DUF1858 domain-containing protein [candidate division KSB1 bacterium]MCB9511688.1 DUF1858 domain-containing protein [Deferribacteres bacterium]